MGGIVEQVLWRELQNNITNDSLGSGSNSTDDDGKFVVGLTGTDETNTDDEALVEYDDGEVLRNTFMVYGSIMLVIILVFCWARRRFKKVYNTRSWVDPIKTKLAEDQFGFFSWMWNVYHVTDDELLDECGMDALCFIRIAQMGFKLAAMGVFNATWLMIVYATSSAADDTKDINDGIVEVTIAHVPEDTPRLIATTLAAYIFFGYAMYLILEDFDWFIEMRHKFLHKPKARNYSIFVRNIPENYRNNQALEEFMRSCFSHDSIVEARVAYTAANLAKTEQNRDTTLFNLEHAIAEFESTGKRPRHTSGLVGGVGIGETVDSIEAYKKDLKALNDQVDESITEIEKKIESSNTMPEWTGMSIALRSVNEENEEVTSFLSHDVEIKEEDSKKDHEEGANHGVGDALKTTGHVLGGAVKTTGDVVGGAVKNTGVKATEAVEDVLGKAGNLAAGAMDLFTAGEDGIAQPSGFVVFNKLATANAALQIVHHATPFSMEIREAPDPDDIMWLNISRTHRDLQVGNLMSLGITVLICLLWTIPMAFIASLSTVEGLRDEVEFIDDMLDALPFLVPLFEIAAPFFVVAVNALLPTILESVTLLEGPISGAVVEASLFVKLAAFNIVQTFFVSAVSGSVIDKIAEMIESPTEIISLLATALPSQATYFLQLSMVSLVVSGGMEILRVLPIGLAVLRSFIGPRLTEKERRTTFFGIRPLYDPLEFQHADMTSNAVFYFMVLLVYSVISPVTNFVLAFIFLAFGTMLRHQFIFIYPTVPDSGGKVWSNFIKILISCIIVAEITILGLLGLKQASIAAPLFVPLLIITILFSYYIRQEHFHVAEFLPIRNCLKQDAMRSEADLDFLKGSYLQPELSAVRRVWPESLSKTENELETPEETYDDPTN